MSRSHLLVDEAAEILGVTPAKAVEGCSYGETSADRAKNDATVADLPGFGRMIVAEGDGLLAITHGKDQRTPALLVVDRGSDDRPPLGIYYSPAPEHLRQIAAFCLDWANRLGGNTQ